MNSRISVNRLDALKELANIGAGNAAASLSLLLNQKISITVPGVYSSCVEKAQEAFGPLETPVVAVYLQLQGDARGALLLSFKRDDAFLLAELLTGKEAGPRKKLGKMQESALKEAATVLVGSYLTALAKLLNMRLLISVPVLAQDMSGAVMDHIFIETSRTAGAILVIDTEFEITNKDVRGVLFFIPEKGSVKKILTALRV